MGQETADASVRRPNLFKFATSELSQDAFICWLVEWARDKNERYDDKLHDCGKDFIALLYNLKHKHDPITRVDVGAIVGEPKQQYMKIDVYFQAKIREKTVSFIIEDKTHTSFHSGQLERYLKEVQSDKITENEIVCVYFKTGCVWPEEKKAIENVEIDGQRHCYHLLNAVCFYEFLNGYKTMKDPIFLDYSDYIYNEFYRSQKHGLDELLRERESKLDNFDYDSVKLAYMYKLLERCSEDIKKCAEYPYHGKNRDGSTWVIFDICQRKDGSGFGDDGETLYCRLDWRNGGYYLALRQYARFDKENATVRENKWNRLQEYKRAFHDTVAELGSTIRFTFDKPVSDWSGNYESEIAVVFFNDSEKSPQQVLDTIPEIIKSFVARIGGASKQTGDD